MVNAQSELDSLKTALKKSKSDTNKLILLNSLIEIAPEGEWEKYNEQLGSEAEKLLKSNNPTIKSCALKHKATFINNNGYIAYHYGDIPKALECYHKSLKIQEQLKNQTAIALAYNNIGFVLSNQGDLEMARDYYQKGLAAYTKVNSRDGIALCLNNLGHIYDQQAKLLIEKNAPLDSITPKLSPALSYYEESLKIHEEIKDKFGIANCYNNIGAIYANLAELWRKNNIKKDSIAYYTQLELEYHLKSLRLMEELGELRGVALSNNNIGWHYYRAKEYGKAESQSLKSMKISRELGFPGNIRDAGKLLFLVYKDQGKYKDALEMHELYITMRDSIQNEKNKKLGIQKQIQYEYDKKAAADSVKVAEEKKVTTAQLKQERTQRFALYGGLALVIVFAGFIFNRFKTTQKQNRIIAKQKTEVEKQRDIIEHQKELVDEKQKEIVDSITYARRLQHAILPPQQFIDEHLPANFVLYKPKDIIAGDFYWMFEADDTVLIAAADSTGHGVPGAMVSIVCSNALDKAVRELKLREPGEILDKTTELVLETFAKSGEEIKDGMDISLLMVDKKNKSIKWSGANNHLWYVSNESQKSNIEISTNGSSLIEITANKQPVGKSDHPKKFTTHPITYAEGTVFYLLTDGYPDQFGGPKGKKYKYKQLEEKLVSIHHLPMQEQKDILAQDFENWKAWPNPQGGVRELEQIDDVTIIGIRI